MPSARLDWLIGSGWAASAVRVHGVGRPKPPICRSVWLNVARTMSIMIVDPMRRPLGCSIPALLLVLTTASLQRFHSRSLVAIYRPLLRHQDQLCQESHTRSLNRCSLLDDLETILITLGAVVPSCTPWPCSLLRSAAAWNQASRKERKSLRYLRKCCGKVVHSLNVRQP
jgi:hypothetical protein